MSLTYNGHQIEYRTDRYLNATQMCSINDKRVNDWLRNKETQEYIQGISAVTGISKDLLVDVVQGGATGKQGTWVHPKLAPKLARWISVEFEVWYDCNINFKAQSDLPFLKTYPKDLSGFIYLAITSNGWCKIGMSKEPYRRMTALQVGTPLEVTLVHRIFTLNMPKLEKALHEYYQAYWMRGEWFDLPQDCIKEFSAIANEIDTNLELVKLPN